MTTAKNVLVADPAAPPIERLEAARYLIVRGMGAQVLGQLSDLAPRHAGELRKLGLLVDYVQRMTQSLDFAGDRRWETLDGRAPGTAEESSGVLLWTRPGAKQVVLVFSNVGGGFAWLGGWFSIGLIHRALQHAAANVVYLRDASHLLHFGGIHGLAGNYSGCVSALRSLLEARGWNMLYALGDSSGGYGALRYGLELEARAVLSLSGLTSLDPAYKFNRHPSLDLIQSELPAFAVDLLPLYRARTRRPRLLLCFGADNEMDRVHALHMAELPETELIPFEGMARHSTLLEAIRTRRLGALAKRLVDI